MELEKMARQLGAAIQQDEAYLNFEKARLANEADEELNDLMGKIRLIPYTKIKNITFKKYGFMLYYYSATPRRCCSFMTQEVFYNGNYKEFNNR